MTAYGIGNTGKLNIPYGKEDTDFYIDGDSTSGYIYRAAESTFFCRIRDLFKSESQAMYVELENKGLWSATRTIKQWDDAQNQFPEELWRLHFQRVYERTYRGISVDNSIAGAANPRFLEEMWNGKKKYQRRMFMRNQELYFATKYFGKVATQDQIMMRFNNPVGATITPDFTLYITPFSDMYIGTSFGNVTPTNFRAKAGVEYTIPCSIESGTADITLIYGASFIQAIGDLSRCYVGDNDFSKASRLQSLIIGSDTEGYENTFMTKINVGNNKLLEHLDIRKVTGLNSVVDLSSCGNLIELHAENSGATGVIFANGGKVEKAYIPSITSLTVKNLNYLEEFEVESYDNLQTLVVENTPFINTYNVVNISPNLKTIRLIGMNWDVSYGITNTSILDRIVTMRGISNTGGEIPLSVLAGFIYVSVIKEHDLNNYQSYWNDLDIQYPSGGLINQFAVTFVNDDGSVLKVVYYDKGTIPTDPGITPTKESTVQYDYTFAGWNQEFYAVFEPQTYTATYTSTVREYTITYVSKGYNNPLQVTTAPYGTTVFYEGEIPKYTGGESAYTYNFFSGWDKSGYVDGDRTINALYDTCNYTPTSFASKELSTMSFVEIYAMIKNSAETSIVESMDEFSFRMGNDCDYSDIESNLLIENTMEFSGSNQYDTGISVMDIDRDFVLAVDYEFAADNTTGATLMQCFKTSSSDGFKLSYNSTPMFTWGASSTQVATGANREMLVIRHVAGETGLHVYTSNLSGEDVSYVELSRNRTMTASSTLVFGCVKADDGAFESYAKGSVHWAKLWYADLGDGTCRDLAAYIHEEITTQMCGFKRKYLSDGSGNRSAMSFLATHTLRTKKAIGTNSGSNIGGWAASPIDTWLNSRFYSGLPLGMKQLVKQVQVKATVDNESSEVPSTDCYVYIPAVIELTNESTYSADPYYSEETAEIRTIDYMVDASDRIRKDSSGTAVPYWTRSRDASGTKYYLYIREDGTVYSYKTPTNEYGIVIEFSI